MPAFWAAMARFDEPRTSVCSCARSHRSTPSARQAEGTTPRPHELDRHQGGHGRAQEVRRVARAPEPDLDDEGVAVMGGPERRRDGRVELRRRGQRGIRVSAPRVQDDLDGPLQVRRELVAGG
jgi:hypothetical protein